MFILRILNISICHYYRTKIVLPKNRWIFLQDSLQSRVILAFTFRSMIYKKSPQKIGGFYGGAKRDRTADLYNAIVALSQLSYSPFEPSQHSGRPSKFDRLKGTPHRRWGLVSQRPSAAQAKFGTCQKKRNATPQRSWIPALHYRPSCHPHSILPPTTPHHLRSHPAGCQLRRPRFGHHRN